MRSSLRANSSIGKKRGKNHYRGKIRFDPSDCLMLSSKKCHKHSKKTKHFSGNSPVFLIAWFLAAVREKKLVQKSNQTNTYLILYFKIEILNIYQQS